MHALLAQRQDRSLLDDSKTYRKIEINHRRNKAQDNTEKMDAAQAAFRYEDCKNEYWNPTEFSLLYGTPLWDQATADQKRLLNQLYWVAYYSQIISAEIATIYFNQTCAASLYGVEDFRLVCDTLDLESAQERAHIAAFKRISEDVEASVFGERLFTYPMRTPFAETMIFSKAGPVERAGKSLVLQGFGVLSSRNPFLACQYFTVRGIRTLNGKLVQHKLSQYYETHPDKDNAPIPSKISYYHFLDESYHFNSSTIIGHDVVNSLPKPTRLESRVANLALWGCQRDHYNFSVAINGIFWFDPALFPTVHRMLCSKAFGMSDGDAKQMIADCFTKENDALHASEATHRTAIESYKAYLAGFEYVDSKNRDMQLMSGNSIEKYLETGRRAFARFASS